MNNADGRVLCVQDDLLGCYSPHSHTLSLLRLQAVTSAVHKPNANDSSQASSFVQDVAHSSGRHAHLANHGTPMDVDRSNTSFRTPIAFSRENSPDIFNLSSFPGSSSAGQYQSSASAQAMFVGNNAALQSLLSSQPVTPHTPHTPLTSSENLSASVRAQPLLYSRGTSGGSSNSNSAYHIRKKRAANASPSPSNHNLNFSRNSPSIFMFESSNTRESLGSSDSPRSASNSAAKTAGRIHSHNDAGIDNLLSAVCM